MIVIIPAVLQHSPSSSVLIPPLRPASFPARVEAKERKRRKEKWRKGSETEEEYEGRDGQFNDDDRHGYDDDHVMMMDLWTIPLLGCQVNV